MPDILSQVFQLIEMSKSNNFPLESGNMLLVGAYLNYQLAIVHQQPDYLPTKEIQMCLSAISTCYLENEAPDDIKFKDGDHPISALILPQLVASLITLMDILIVRDPESPIFLEAMLLLDRLPASAFQSIQPSQIKTSVIVKSLADSKEFSSRIESHILTLDELTEQLDHVVSPDSEEYEELIPKINSFKTSLEKGTITDLFCAYTQLITSSPNFESRKRIPNKLFEGIFRLLANRNKDSQAFVANCLDAWDKAYHTAALHGQNLENHRLALLETMDVFLPVLSELDKSGMLFNWFQQLSKVVKQPDVGPKGIYFLSTRQHVLHRTAFPFDMSNLAHNVTDKDSQQLHAIFDLLLANPGIFLQFLRMASKNPTASPVTPVEVHDQISDVMPLSLLKYRNENSNVANELNTLIKHLLTINGDAGKHQQRNIQFLLLIHQIQLEQLIRLLGKTAIKAMKQMVVNTVLPLERLLKKIPLIQPNLLAKLAWYCTNNVRSAGEVTFLIQCLIVLGPLLKKRNGAVLIKEILEKNSKIRPEELLVCLINLSLHLILPTMNTPLDEKTCRSLLKRIPLEKLVGLVAATTNMENDNYRNVYLKFLELDLFGGSITDFLYNTHSKTYPKNSLAKHNQTIRRLLSKQGIDPDLALHYPQKNQFILLPEGNLQNEPLESHYDYKTLWTDLENLDKEIETILSDTADDKLGNNLQNIQKHILQLRKNLKKKTSTDGLRKSIDYDVLSKPENTALLRKITKNLRHLRKNRTVLPSHFFDFGRQYNLEDIDQLLKTTATQAASRESNQHYFTVELWNKEDPKTLNLGAYVNCCLAPNGTKFPAMVQRRLDAAMPIVVIIDEDIKEPIAAVWLYFALTKENTIVIVSNFFEVNSRFGQDVYKRKAILNAMLSFIEQYLEDNPGISAFYMADLPYGWNRGDLDHYDVEDVVLVDKVGGAYVPSDFLKAPHVRGIPEQSITKSTYYLTSLSEPNTTFRKFSSDELHKSQNPNTRVLDNILHNKVLSLTKNTELTFETLSKAVFKSYRNILSHFYALPLESNPALLDRLYEEYTNATIFHKTGGHLATPVGLMLQNHAFFSKFTSRKDDKSPNEDEDLNDTEHGPS